MGIDDSGEHSQTTNSDGERPFKKAKYAWQVKGRSHLKEKNTPQNEDVSTDTNSESTNDTTQRCRNCAQNNYLNTILNHSEYLMDDVGKSSKSQVPVSMVPKTKKTYDQYLAIWQANQLAKCFLDNTINTVFEKWMIAPFDDANDLIENCENGGIVEDEGILMAIQSHGLQSNSNIPNDGGMSYSDSGETRSTDLPECTCNSRKPSTTKQPETARNNEDIDISTTIHNQTVITNPVEPSVNVEHFDFLSTAVAVAIQKKGLNF